MRRILALSLLLLFSLRVSVGQLSTSTNISSDMPDTADGNEKAGREAWNKDVLPLRVGEVKVVTLSHLNHQSTCKIAHVSAQQLECEAGAFGRGRVYRREDIAALIQPAVHDNTGLWMLGWFGSGAGMITGACLLAPVSLGATIPLAIIGTWFVITTPYLAMGADGGTSPAEFIYRRPGVDLSSVRLAGGHKTGKKPPQPSFQNGQGNPGTALG